MSASGPRRGIERKILNTILQVAILPLIIAVIVGYITAREGQGNAVEQSLLTAARKTADGLRIAAAPHLQKLDALSKDPKILAAVQPGSSGKPAALQDSAQHEQLREYLNSQITMVVSTPGVPTILTVYDAEGHLIASTHEELHTLTSEDNGPGKWKDSRIVKPRFLDIDEIGNAYAAESAAPIYQNPEDREGLLGFVAQILDITPLLLFAMGIDPTDTADDSLHAVYQVVYTSEGYHRTTYIARKSEQGTLNLDVCRTDSALSKKLQGPESSSYGTLRIPGYVSTKSQTEDVFLAYAQMFDDMDLYIVVYRSAATALRNIHLAGIIAIVFCVGVIAILCLNAYLNIHNSIVRPLSLLNEGAQIIGQGDLDLKLKIGTGDEIEELAQSFNKMALALKRNIGQLEDSEEKYRGLVTWMRDGVFQTNPQWIVGFMNPAGVEIFRHEDVEEIIGRNISDMFYNPSDFTQLARELQHKGFIERRRLWMRRRDERAIIVELSANTIYGDDNSVIGYEGIFRDLSKSVRLEREARDRAERLSAISQIANVINSSLEAGRLYESLVVEIKRLIDFDFASLALLDELGETFEIRQLWPEAKAIELETGAMHDETSCAAWVARERERLMVGDLTRDDVRFSNAEFAPGTRSCLCVPLYATGRIIGTFNLGSERPDAFRRHDAAVLEQVAPHVAVAIRNANLLENLQVSLEDVTLAREKLHEANEELKSLDEMKTNLLSNVSHELRTPLVAVMGYTDMIYNGKAGPVTETQKDYLGISLRNIEKLVTLIENLLDFSRLHRGTETIVFGVFDLVECAKASIQTMKPVADSQGVELVLQAPDEPQLVEGDKSKLGQVFNNLLSNGVKFNHKGGNVTVALRPGTEDIEVTVSDTGIGIPPDALDKVFTRFYQLDGSSTRKYGGTGIGLSIAQDIARLHGSRITVTSEVGEGATFRFTLPFTKLVRGQSLVQAAVDEPAGPLVTEILVELLTRDSDLSNQVRALLSSESVNSIQAQDAAQAIALARRHSPDCILVDADASEENERLLDVLLADATIQTLPMVLVTNDEDLFEKYRSFISARLKREFRKSTLLSSIHNAVRQPIVPESSLGGKILCVDDDPDVLVFLRRCLETDGYEIDECESGEEALARLRSREYALVLLDIAMPGMDGWETCLRIKSDPALAGIKVFMVTAKPLDAKNPLTKSSGCDGFIQKPFRAEDIVEIASRLLKRPHAIRRA
ncbi:MAG TPA: ATP-binding protein [Candidatus Hydrogenedentes bacterium]|jgi:PAS domain S-box-containing protein|nr:ATP-binding protein [Candidatus Hydrogenedentota bacterium]